MQQTDTPSSDSVARPADAASIFDADGALTREYLLARGTCCGNICRNCPYGNSPSDQQGVQKKRVAPVIVAIVAFLVVFAPPANAAPQRVIDDLGRMTILPHGAQRIVALDPSSAETLFAVGAGARVVATSSYSNYPPAIATVPKINSLQPNLELLVSLRPDLVIVSDQTMSVPMANQKARQLRCPVFVTNGGTYQAIESDIERVGSYFGQPTVTLKVIAKMSTTLATVQKRVARLPKPKVFYVVWSKPLMTAGQGSFISNLIALAGGVDVAANSPKYSQYSTEQLVVDDPDVILSGNEGLSGVRDALLPLSLPAVTSARVYGVAEDLTVRPGPRLSEGLVAIAKVLHPEAFRK